MKPRAVQDKEQIPASKPLAISFPEIALVFGYFLAVWLIPTSWLDTAIGAIAFAIASKVNPYLSEYSIAFAADPQYFIHCHVLATLIASPLLALIILRKNGGVLGYTHVFIKSLENHSATTIIMAYTFGLVSWLTMLWLVDYPLVKAERGVWINPVGVSLFALISGGMLSILSTSTFFLKALIATWKGGLK